MSVDARSNDYTTARKRLFDILAGLRGHLADDQFIDVNAAVVTLVVAAYNLGYADARNSQGGTL